MNTTLNTSVKLNAVELLCKFVNQRAGLEFANYGDYKSYRQESREITKDRSDFYELLQLAQRRYDGNFSESLTEYLQKQTGRLTLNEPGKLEYCTGQYFPTEYRPAACRVLVSMLWDSYRDEKDSEGKAIYSDGHAIRKAIKRNLSRRVYKNYFN